MKQRAGIIGAGDPIDRTPVEESDLTVSMLLRSIFFAFKRRARNEESSAGGGPLLKNMQI